MDLCISKNICFKKTSAYIDFSITADYLEHKKISEDLQICASYEHKKGDLCKYGGKVYQCAGWGIRSEEVETEDLGAQLNKFFFKIKDKIDELVSIKSTYSNCYFMLSVVVYVKDKFLPGIYLNQQQLSFLNAIKAEIEFDVYL